MKKFLLFVFMSYTGLSYAQDQDNCDQLAVLFHGVLHTKETNQLIFEVSNQIYTGTLYNYPGWVLLNEQGDTIAKESVTYYGIGLNFQVHRLDILKEIRFPFVGYLQLYGSYYKNLFCEFPIELESAEIISLEHIRNAPLRVGTNMEESQVVVDFGNVDVEKPEFYFNITNEIGEVVYEARTDSTCFSISVKEIGKAGIYYLSVWNAVQKKLLPTGVFEIQ